MRLLTSWPRSQWGALLFSVAMSVLMPSAHGADAIVTADRSGLVGTQTSIVLDNLGLPVVSYRDSTNLDLKVLHCTGRANCRGRKSISSPDAAGSVGLYTSLVLDGGGNPVVSYSSSSIGNLHLKVLHCNDSNCAGGDESIESLDTGGNVGSYTSLVLDGGGNPVVSYFDFTNKDLKVLHCDDSNCAGGGESIESPDTGGNVGLYTSIVLDSSGNPVVSYSDSTNFDLKVLHCNDSNCAGGDESIESPDTRGIVGEYTSLVLNSSGNPVVSYHDRTNGNLKVLTCDDPNCAK